MDNTKFCFFSAIQEEDDDEGEEAGEVEDMEDKPAGASADLRSPAKIYTADELIDYFKTFKRMETELITVGFVGYPNVGKSSTINKLVKSKKVRVSDTPGKTKHFQTLILSEDLTLCDCPGLVMPSIVASKADMVSVGTCRFSLK